MFVPIFLLLTSYFTFCTYQGSKKWVARDMCVCGGGGGGGGRGAGGACGVVVGQRGRATMISAGN